MLPIPKSLAHDTPPRIDDNTLSTIDTECPSIVPSIVDLHISLINKFQIFTGTVETILNRESVKEIAYLLHDCHNTSIFL